MSSPSSAPAADDAVLTVAIAAPLAPEHVRLLEQTEPRLRVLYEPSLLPPMRYPADFSGDPAFRRSAAEQERFESLLDEADALYGVPDVNPQALQRVVRANTGLTWVHTMAAGGGGSVKAADLTPEELSRVTFTTSAGVHGAPLAEFALFGLLAGAKHLPRLRELQARHEWPDRWPMDHLAGSTVLILGLGGIGAVLAESLRALGVHVIGNNRSGRPVTGVDELVPIHELDSVLPRVDAMVSTLPGTHATEGLLDARVFSLLPHGAVVVNVGRGTVIDETALLEALGSGKVGFAALDVFATEPLPSDSPLWDHPNVLVSPHTAALTLSEEQRIVELFARNAAAILDGDTPRNVVDTHDFY